MKKIFYIIIGLFIFCTTNSYGQLFHKKKQTASGKSGTYESQKHRDAFSGKSKKGPNVYSPNGPGTKSKSNYYKYSTSKKKSKRGKKQAVFSSKKKRYKSTVTTPGGSKDKGAKTSSGGRKSGKGRKKK